AEQIVELGLALGAVQPDRSCSVADERPSPEPDEMPVVRALGRGGWLGTLHLPNVGVRRGGGNLELELDQELHAVLLVLIQTRRRQRLEPASGKRGRDADVLHAARLTALARTASRMTPATMSGCDIISRWEAPST